MELLIATWIGRAALLAFMVVGASALASGWRPELALLTASFAVFIVSMLGGWMIDLLETPEQRLRRLRARRRLEEGRRHKRGRAQPRTAER